jgi:hypothetical protein
MSKKLRQYIQHRYSDLRAFTMHHTTCCLGSRSFLHSFYSQNPNVPFTVFAMPKGHVSSHFGEILPAPFLS